ncbi:uncharacterized protein LOC129598738 isoform X2 [Paramacrobiotus metropolitanus]|uniref:uncharacterized protein LOC129598738 isoform X2 n=1 Tax=Paramacrobiotus metropolitanus TaxID=2943436 RepID=UPI002445C7BE|nr:uncharacterized protein LOC129598738 isoform X2 [Paramacrobiotus metropolitanus]
MICQVFTEDNNVINKNQHVPPLHVRKRQIHGALESRRRVLHPKSLEPFTILERRTIRRRSNRQTRTCVHGVLINGTASHRAGFSRINSADGRWRQLHGHTFMDFLRHWNALVITGNITNRFLTILLELRRVHLIDRIDERDFAKRKG